MVGLTTKANAMFIKRMHCLHLRKKYYYIGAISMTDFEKKYSLFIPVLTIGKMSLFT